MANQRPGRANKSIFGGNLGALQFAALFLSFVFGSIAAKIADANGPQEIGIPIEVALAFMGAVYLGYWLTSKHLSNSVAKPGFTGSYFDKPQLILSRRGP